MVQRGQIEDIQSTMMLENVPAFEDSLIFCRGKRDRRRLKLPTQLPATALSRLKSWVSEPSSSLLLAQGQGVRTSSLDFAADLLDAIIERGYPILWALPSSIEDDNSPPTITGILKSLLVQILRLDPSIVSEGSHPVTVNNFKSATTLSQWFALLERCIADCPRLFVVIDMGLIEAATSDENSDCEYFKAGDFTEQLSEIVNRRGKGGLKIVIVSWRFQMMTSLSPKDIFGDEQILTDMGKRRERLMRQPKYRAIFRGRSRTVGEKLKSSICIVNSR